ncbi:putative quinol monooxygenase [Gordonia neofelifaecis]|uniref:Antibiotic biosynthesis monooxygenase n=1 Tax=Gordonia neofelifaecis NRRL B-59395 TaxID=644548 RepID=F1YLW4_9ACTN|nr:putative quinol monooxygenase [Gordonia neofelifaecis]EGD54215.1 antibiotic biosynthesis monooxygenase [Gordonia neofelifaecis NRRL B-59395]
MHTAFIKLRVHADHADRAADAMRGLVQPVSAEPGCITYEFYRDLDDPCLFHCFEHWTSRQALDDHGSTPHIRAFLDEFGPHIELWESHHTAALD